MICSQERRESRLRVRRKVEVEQLQRSQDMFRRDSWRIDAMHSLCSCLGNRDKGNDTGGKERATASRSHR
jgi:hypothetical protein